LARSAQALRSAAVPLAVRLALSAAQLAAAQRAAASVLRR
jgi:hypothetical protein